jgi:hypothetical protein
VTSCSKTTTSRASPSRRNLDLASRHFQPNRHVWSSLRPNAGRFAPGTRFGAQTKRSVARRGQADVKAIRHVSRVPSPFAPIAHFLRQDARWDPKRSDPLQFGEGETARVFERASAKTGGNKARRLNSGNHRQTRPHSASQTARCELRPGESACRSAGARGRKQIRNPKPKPKPEATPGLSRGKAGASRRLRRGYAGATA